MKRILFTLALCCLLIQPIFAQLAPKQWVAMSDGERFAYIVGFREGLDAGMELLDQYLQAFFEDAWTGMNADKVPGEIVALLTEFLEKYDQRDSSIAQLLFLLDDFIEQRGIQIPGDSEEGER